MSPVARRSLPSAVQVVLILGLLCAVATAPTAAAFASFAPPHRSVPLASIETLTFYAGELTTARRGRPIPQLTCIGAACPRYEHYVHVVQCRNAGDDGTGNIQWQCKTDLPQKLRLGRVEVSCEGWSRAGDENVLQGSCGLEYTLFKEGSVDHDREKPFCSSKSCQSILSTLFNVLFFGVLALIATSFIRACLANRRQPSNSPPPYSPGPGHGGGGGSGGGGGNDGSSGGKGPLAQRWRPGFWTGLGLAGAAAWVWDLTRPVSREGTGGVDHRHRSPDYGGVDNPHCGRDWDQPGPSRQHGRAVPRHGESDDPLGEVRTSVGFGGSTVR